MNRDKAIGLLQDLQVFLTDVEAGLTDHPTVNLNPVATSRRLRKATGDLLNDLTNEQLIVEGYREDAIDALDGVGFMAVGGAAGSWTDPYLQQAMLAMFLAAGRIKKYFRAKQAAAKEATCEAG